MLALLLGRGGSALDHRYVTLYANAHTAPTVLPQINEIKSRNLLTVIGNRFIGDFGMLGLRLN